MDTLAKLEAELEEKELKDLDGLTPLEYKKLLLIYFCARNYIDAKYLLRRMPEDMKQSSEIKACVDAFKYQRNLKFGKALHVLADNEWCDEIGPLVELVHSSWYKFAVRSVAKIYNCLKVDDFIKMGFDHEEVMKICKEHDWDVKGELIYPIKGEKVSEEDDEVDDSVPDNGLSNLVDFSCHLEQF